MLHQALPVMKQKLIFMAEFGAPTDETTALLEAFKAKSLNFEIRHRLWFLVDCIDFQGFTQPVAQSKGTIRVPSLTC